jgi:pimeloyl-ACP methyl ester carboxylesterase
VDWARCVADTVAATAELRARAGVDRVVAFGARLGGSVALAASAQARFSEVIAWDAVLDGAGYVAALDAMQAALREDAERFTRPRSEADVAEQWLGFDIGDRLRHQLAALRVPTAGVPTLLLESSSTLGQPTPWNDLRRLETAILSQPLIQAVTGRLKEMA